ncbi:MAG: NnrS protein involved in response to, partial [Verrucomicrobiaceae bacterium]|nr:NnrS protein involved in response to [Verrucomicrobiaceae bacterium]
MGAAESTTPPARQPLWPLLAAEPFRLFFPWALLLGLAGVMLWPLFLAHQLHFLPAVPHTRLMIMGFGGGCVIGFLGTAAPGLLGARPLGKYDTLWLFVLHAAAVGSCAMLHDEMGCALFAATLIVLLMMLARRFITRTDMPPPGFVMVLAGLLCGIAGAIMFALNLDFKNAFCFRFTRLLMNEAFLLLPVLGVSGFLVTRILELPSRQTFPESRIPLADWWCIACEALLATALLIATFAVEATGEIQMGAGMRFCLIMGWWLRDMPGLWRAKTLGTQAWMLRVGLGFIAAAPLLLAIDPRK